MLNPETAKISVIIPTLNAEKELSTLLDSLFSQKRQINELIIVDSASTDKTVEICKANEKVRLIQIERKDFDHGKTRDMALRESIGDIVVFMTQDAIPVNDEFLENLITPLAEDKVAVSTGRQLPKKDATRMEQLIRTFNYPPESHIRSKADIPQMGIKTFFCSDVCAAYNRKFFLELGGFEYPLKTNEDMFFAAKAINADYQVAYTANALVYHSHNFTLKEQFKRNYIQGYEIERHKELLNGVKQESEGIKLVKIVSKELLKRRDILSFINFGLDSCIRLIGSKAGRRFYLKKSRYVTNESEKKGNTYAIHK